MAVPARSKTVWSLAAVLLLVPVGFALIWVGYSLSGCPLDPHELELLGEPTRVGPVGSQKRPGC